MLITINRVIKKGILKASMKFQNNLNILTPTNHANKLPKSSVGHTQEGTWAMLRSKLRKRLTLKFSKGFLSQLSTWKNLQCNRRLHPAGQPSNKRGMFCRPSLLALLSQLTRSSEDGNLWLKHRNYLSY